MIDLFMRSSHPPKIATRSGSCEPAGPEVNLPEKSSSHRGAGQPQAYQQAAQVVAFAQLHGSPVNLGDVAHDRKAQSRARLTRIEPRAAIEQEPALVGGDSGAVVLNPDLALPARGLGVDRDEDAAAAVLGGVLDQVAEH